MCVLKAIFSENAAKSLVTDWLAGILNKDSKVFTLLVTFVSVVYNGIIQCPLTAHSAQIICWHQTKKKLAYLFLTIIPQVYVGNKIIDSQ